MHAAASRGKRIWASSAALVFALAAGWVLADAGAERASRVPTPTLEAGKGDKCVADTDFMRRNHMKLLLHQRDDTMHLGLRTRRFSLNGCIECHASRKTGSVVGSDQNFCQSCHAYAAVKIDCFECHASRPAKAAALADETGARIAR